MSGHDIIIDQLRRQLDCGTHDSDGRGSCGRCLVCVKAAHDSLLDRVRFTLRQRDEARAEIERLYATLREHQRNALPLNCTHCNGIGAEPPGCPESGPCERCGGWTAHKRLIASECSTLRAERDAAIARAQKADADALDLCVEVSKINLLLDQANDRAEKAEALRDEAEQRADVCSANHEGAIRDLRERLMKAERERDEAVYRTYVPADEMKKRIDAYWDGWCDALRNVAIGLACDAELGTPTFAKAGQLNATQTLYVLAGLGDADAKRIVGGG